LIKGIENILKAEAKHEEKRTEILNILSHGNNI
jgi:pyruvate,water dikinase